MVRGVFLFFGMLIGAFVQDACANGEYEGVLLTDGTESLLSTFRNQCPGGVTQMCLYTGTITAKTCSTSVWKELGAVGNTKLFLVQYMHKTTFDWSTPSSQTPEQYVCRGKENYILESSNGTSAHAVWLHAREVITDGGVDDAKLYQVGEAQILVVYYWTGGTGGYYEEDYIRIDGQWQQLEHDESWDVAYQEMPKEYGHHKSPYIDFSQLTWEEHIAKSLDPNCCPSGKIQFKLAIVNNKLHVISHKFIFNK